MPTIVGILTFISRINFVLSWVDNGKSFITPGPVGLCCAQWIKLIQSKQVDKAVPFHDPLKWLKLNTFASDDVIKKENVKTTHMLIYYVKLYMLHPLLISALILET